MATTPKHTRPRSRLNLWHLPVMMIVAACLIFGAGCASAPPKHPSQRFVSATPDAVDLSNTELVKKILYRQLQDWQGVRYRIGGLSKEGVDCSGFVYLTFLSEFGIQIPRSTELQVSAGDSVPLKRIKTGDLVFFRTGVKSRHVGIYVDQKRFVHASKSSGVVLSRLDDTYWQKRYWKSVRIELTPLQ